MWDLRATESRAVAIGTNYYLETHPCEKACEHCSKAERVHICKSLVSFQGYPVGVCRTVESIHERGIRSWDNWKVALRDPEVCRVVDECGEAYSVEAFIALVEVTERELRERQYRWVARYRVDLIGAETEWLDPEGFSFTSVDFS